MTVSPVESALAQFPTPFYLFDAEILSAQISHIRALLPAHVELCYAMKANAFITDKAASEVERIEACSPGEVRICQACGVPDAKIVISGVHKDAELMRELVTEHPAIARYTVESIAQFDLLEQVAREAGRRISILIRLTSGNQFGVDAVVAKDLAARCTENGPLELAGIQLFSGTQKTSLKRMKKELDAADRLIGEIEAECGMSVAEFEYGPGLPVLYFDEDNVAESEQDDIARGLGELLQSMSFQGRIAIELGRAIAASCGTYATRVVDAKSNGGNNYAIVDGGKHQIAYYGNAMAMKQPPCRMIPERAGSAEPWNICGSLCTVTDILVKQLPISDLHIGDAVVFERAGAYCATEGIALFLCRDLPRVIVRDHDGELHLVRDRIETYPLNNPAR